MDLDQSLYINNYGKIKSWLCNLFCGIVHEIWLLNVWLIINAMGIHFWLFCECLEGEIWDNKLEGLAD